VDTGPSIVPYLCPSGTCQRITATACSLSLLPIRVHDRQGIARHQPAISKMKKKTGELTTALHLLRL